MSCDQNLFMGNFEWMVLSRWFFSIIANIYENYAWPPKIMLYYEEPSNLVYTTFSIKMVLRWCTTRIVSHVYKYSFIYRYYDTQQVWTFDYIKLFIKMPIIRVGWVPRDHYWYLCIDTIHQPILIYLYHSNLNICCVNPTWRKHWWN